MRIAASVETDVLVIGAGLAGVSAAIAAGRAGARCALASAGPIFSGSSFYPGTWGFGLIGPEDSADAADLADTIETVGMGMAEPALVRVLVENIPRRVSELESWGIPLKRPERGGEREFIPCFDHKRRDWYGLVQKDARAGLGAQLDRYGVQRFPRTQAAELIRDGRVRGALALTPEGLIRFACRSCVIASGGLGGLFRHALTSRDVGGAGQYLALRAGAKLVNLEFNQIMPGYLSPCPRTVYNEKIFRYTAFLHPETGRSLFADLPAEEVRGILEARSGHGPFTSRLISRAADLRLAAACAADERGVPIRCEGIPEPMPEFVRTYFDWLRDEKGVTEKDEARLGLFYHAANGGIKIDREARTGVPGLFACGECTGGMHGADRLGGLSTANALVFGAVAGENAAAEARETEPAVFHGTQTLLWETAASGRILDLRRCNSLCCMVIRTQANLRRALDLSRAIAEGVRPAQASEDGPELAASYRFYAALTLSEALQMACDLRRESRGSHYRADYPAPDPKYEKRILLSMEESRVQADFEWRGDGKTGEMRELP